MAIRVSRDLNAYYVEREGRREGERERENSSFLLSSLVKDGGREGTKTQKENKKIHCHAKRTPNAKKGWKLSVHI